MCFICISLIPAVSCAKKDDIPADKLSLIRYDILVAEDDDVKIAVYLEKRESPYREDGNPAELKPHIVIKATAVDDFDIENADMFAEVITGDKKYSSQFGFRPISFSRECHLSPQTLLGGDLSLIISLNGERRTYNLVSIIKSDIISYADAIISARNYAQGALDAYWDDENYGEIRVRVLENDGEPYWYVGFINGEQTAAYLVAGTTGETVASRTEPCEK